jgi:spore germination cell wall hydrolase CwlJ-like protein
MSTRRIAATALLGLPILGTATKALAISKPEIPLPYSEEAALIISYTIYAEARGEDLFGKRAVASVIKTRARLHKISPAEVCLKEKQFSCWNELSAVPSRYRTGEGLMPADIRSRADCFSLAWVLMSSRKEWIFLTHFYNPSVVTPSWASELEGKQQIGKHVFGYIL